MNTGFILEEMGYEFGVDYHMNENDELVWLSPSKPLPSDATIQNAWDAYVATIPATKLASARTRAVKKVDAIAEEKRLEYISQGTGQALVYEEKAKQAQEFKDGGYVNSENYLFIEKESIATGVTAQVLADSILANRDAWISVGSDIEQERVVTKENIRNAADEDAMMVEIVRYITALEAI